MINLRTGITISQKPDTTHFFGPPYQKNLFGVAY